MSVSRLEAPTLFAPLPIYPSQRAISHLKLIMAYGEIERKIKYSNLTYCRAMQHIDKFNAEWEKKATMALICEPQTKVWRLTLVSLVDGPVLKLIKPVPINGGLPNKWLQADTAVNDSENCDKRRKLSS